MTRLVGLELMVRHHDLLPAASLRTFEDLRRADPHTRARVLADPVVRIWLRRAIAALGDGDPALAAGATAHLTRFGDVVRGALLAGSCQVDGIRVVRRDVDPLLREVAPPTYDFGVPPRASAYDLGLFVEVANAAIERIEAAWPQLRRSIPRFVRLMVHVPDGGFRSASAARFAGAVFFSADDHTVLDLEESIVHEYGHQILYTAMELDPLVTDGEDGSIVLPWSGSVRDWYGFFHACFIYVLLAEYLSARAGVRVGPLPGPDHRRVLARRDEIVDGIDQAMDVLSAGSLTGTGERVVASLADRVRRLHRRSPRGASR